MIGEYHYYKAITSQEPGGRFIEHTVAAEINPLSPRIRESGALVWALNPAISPEMVLPKLEKALQYDPWSPNLLYHKIINQVYSGINPEKTIEKIRKTGNWPQVETLLKEIQ